MKSVLQNLLELYEYDFSEFNGNDLNEHGLYGYRYLDHYWTQDGRYAHFICVDDKLAGFALVRTLNSSLYQMSEFFIARKYRRKAIGKEAATVLFDKFPGRWEVSQEDCNAGAQEFWWHVIGEYTKGAFEESRRDVGPFLLFDTRKS